MEIKSEVVSRINSINFKNVFIKDINTNIEYTYNDFFVRILNLVDALNNYRLDKKLVIIMDNSLELLMLYFANMFTSKIIIPIDCMKGINEVEDILMENKNSTLIYNDSCSFNIDDEKYMLNKINIRDLLDNKKNFYENIKKLVISKFENIDYNNDYLITYTSGTSGKAKGVKHSLNNLFSAAIRFGRIIKFDSENNFGHVMPMTYMAGILNAIIKPFIFGSKITILNRFNIRSAIKFWDAVQKYKVNTLWMSPSMLNILLRMDRTYKGIEYCINNKVIFLIGTAALSKELKQEAEDKYNIQVYASYGLSETLFISVQNTKSLEGSVGKILDDVDIKFSSDGEILINVPWMFKGYTNKNTDEFFEDAYYKSGDLGKIENKEELFIEGRKKDLIVKGGINISPYLIEKSIMEIYEIDEVAVFEGKNKNKEEIIICAYSLKNKENVNIEKRIREKIIKDYGIHYSIDYLFNMNEIPKNINGKIDKNKLKEIYRRNYDS